MSRQDVAADRVLSLTLKFGAYTAFALIVAGLILQHFTSWLLASSSCGSTISGMLLFLLACLRLWCWHMCWGYRREIYREGRNGREGKERKIQRFSTTRLKVGGGS
jgi:polyferredoxin